MGIRIALKTLVAFTLICFFVAHMCQSFPVLAKGDSRAIPAAESGTIDLSEWDFERDGIVALDGEWGFYWRELLKPGEWLTRDVEASYVHVPHRWSSYDLGNQRLSNHGYATYRLAIRLDRAELGKRFSLWIPAAATAYRLWINDTEVGGNGVVGTERSNMEPKNYSKSFVFTPDSTVTEITLQVSNFVQRKGGLWRPIKLGYAEQVDRAQIGEVVTQASFAGIVLIIGFYHLLLFFLLRLDSREALVFGVLCIIGGVRILVTGHTLLVQLFPAISWELAVKIEYWAFLLSSALLMFYIQSLFPQETNRRFVGGVKVLTAVLCVLVLLFPAAVYTNLLLLFTTVAVVNLVYAGFVLSLAARRKRKDVWLHVIGWFFCSVSAVHDSIFYNWAVPTDDLLPYGILIAIVIQVVFLSLRYSRAFRDIKCLSGELARLNNSLEMKIRERTAELEKANEELRDAWRKLSQNEQSRRRLISNISHEIGTPLSIVQGYVKGMIDGVIPAGDPKSLNLILDKTKMLVRLIDDLGELSKLEARQVSFEMSPILVSEFIAQVADSMRWEFEQAGLTLETGPSAEQTAADAYVLADAMRLEQVMHNLLTNARKHTPSGGCVQIDVNKTEVNGRKMVTVSVTDNGEGIPAEALPFVFDRYYQVERKGGARRGMGLGLAISKEIIEIHGGHIGVESKVGEGSRFYFSLPLYGG